MTLLCQSLHDEHVSPYISDFLKKDTCEVQAFLKAIQLYRQDQGQYEAWDMLIGSDGRVRTQLHLNLQLKFRHNKEASCLSYTMALLCFIH